MSRSFVKFIGKGEDGQIEEEKKSYIWQYVMDFAS